MNDYKKYTDTIWFGIVSGLLIPVVSFLMYWKVKHNYMEFNSFISYLISGDVYTQMMSLCIIPNLALFFIFIQLQYNRAGYGVIASTLLYTIVNFALKLL